MFAVFKSGSHQHKVSANDVIRVQKIPGEAGQVVQFDQVLLIGNDADGSLVTDTKTLSKASVTAEIVAQMRDKKLIVFKKRRRKNYRRRNGHRQYLTLLRVKEVVVFE